MLKKRLAKGSVYEIINFILIIIKGVLLLPLILSYWSPNKYGIFIAILSFIELCKILDTGFQIYVRNLINFTYHNDLEKSKNILASGVSFSLSLGFFEFLIGVILLLVFRIDTIFFGAALSSLELFSLLSYLFVWSLVGSASGIISYLLQTTGKYYVEVMYMIVQLFAQIFILIMASFFNYSISTVLFLYSTSFLILSSYFILDVKKKCPQFFPFIRKGSINEGYRMFKMSIFISYANSLELIITNSTPLIINYFLNPVALVTFNAVKTISNALSQLSNLFTNPLLPELVKLYAQKKYIQILNLLRINWLIIVPTLCIGTILINPFMHDLFTFWTRDKIVYPNILILTLLFSTLINIYIKPLRSFFSSINNLRFISISLTYKFVLYIILVVPLIKFFGIDSLGFIFLLCEVVLLLHTVIELKINKLFDINENYFQYHLIRIFPIIATIVSMSLTYLLRANLIFSLMISIISISIILYFVSRNKKEIIFLKFKL